MGVFKKDDIWWIDYYVNGHRKRERIGPNHKLAKQVLAKRRTEIAEGKFLEKKKEFKLRIDQLIKLYLRHTKDIKKSHRRDINSADHFLEFFKQKPVASITPVLIEEYRVVRKKHRTRDGKPPAPATINREISFLKRVFSWAIENKLISENPVRHIKMYKEDNIRDRVLSEDEFDKLLKASPDHLKPILITAYFTGMRKSEILNLTWDQVDIENGFIQLRAEDTKTNESRLVPLHPVVINILEGIKKVRGVSNVFTYQKQPILDIKRSFGYALKQAGIENFRFHDFRHTAITNWRRQGHDYFKIMAASGHKTMSVFKRYNTVSKKDLKSLVEGTLESPNFSMDTYMDTKAKNGIKKKDKISRK